MRQAEIADLIRPSIESLGLVLWTLEYSSRGHRGLLRVFIDEAERGANIDDCEKVSREISAVLDAADPFSGAYTLEVSTPGLDRGLYELDHYRQFAGHQVKLKLRTPWEGRKNFNGLLVGVEDEDVVIRQDEEEFLFPLDLIEKANLVPQFETKGK